MIFISFVSELKYQKPCTIDQILSKAITEPFKLYFQTEDEERSLMTCLFSVGRGLASLASITRHTRRALTFNRASQYSFVSEKRKLKHSYLMIQNLDSEYFVYNEVIIHISKGSVTIKSD